MRHTIKTVIRMNTLTIREQDVLDSINVLLESNKDERFNFVTFEDLVDFDLNNTRDELKEIVKSLRDKGALNNIKLFMF